MARRIDSLAQLRTNFFAIGVAHLPGNSGVITLLQKRGFKVKPVFSSKKKMAPESYTYKQVAPWISYVQNEQLYKAEYPGAPQPSEMYKQITDMQYHVDLGTLKGYYTAVINSVAE